MDRDNRGDKRGDNMWCPLWYLCIQGMMEGGQQGGQHVVSPVWCPLLSTHHPPVVSPWSASPGIQQVVPPLSPSLLSPSTETP